MMFAIHWHAATGDRRYKKEAGLADPPLNLNCVFILMTNGSDPAAAKEAESTHSAEKRSGGLRDSGDKLEARGARLDRGSNP